MEQRSHAVIAGTGRAGTTFLIKYLNACGVPCGDLDQLPEFEEARAGKETSLLHPDAPYLVKDPWLDEYTDQIDLSTMSIDALLVPVRNLRESAMSRTRQERAALLRSGQPGIDRHSFGTVPGGIRYSLGVVDQERVLAVGQANLIEWALTNEIPLYLLQFPRLVEDEEYLPKALQPWLGHYCDDSRAKEAFRELSDPSKWYTSDSEISNEGDDALMVLIDDLRSEIEALNLVLNEQRRELEQQGREFADLRGQHSIDNSTIATLRSDLELTAAQLGQANHTVELLQGKSETLSQEVNALRTSRSFRLGRVLSSPLRLFGSRE